MQMFEAFKGLPTAAKPR